MNPDRHQLINADIAAWLINLYHQGVALVEQYQISWVILFLLFSGFMTIVSSRLDNRGKPKLTLAVSGKSIGHQNEAEAKQRAVGNELSALEEQAGISAQADRARDDYTPYGWDSDVEFYTAEGRKENEDYFSLNQENTKWRLRDLYFAVPDLDLRKALIVKERDLHYVWLGWWDAQVLDAQIDLARARRPRWTGLLTPVLLALFLVPASWHDFQVPGAIIATFACYLFGQHMKDAVTEEGAEAIAQAEADLEEAKKNRDKSRTRLPAFTRSEARTGEPTDKGAAHVPS